MGPNAKNNEGLIQHEVRIIDCDVLLRSQAPASGIEFDAWQPIERYGLRIVHLFSKWFPCTRFTYVLFSTKHALGCQIGVSACADRVL